MVPTCLTRGSRIQNCSNDGSPSGRLVQGPTYEGCGSRQARTARLQGWESDAGEKAGSRGWRLRLFHQLGNSPSAVFIFASDGLIVDNRAIDHRMNFVRRAEIRVRVTDDYPERLVRCMKAMNFVRRRHEDFPGNQINGPVCELTISPAIDNASDPHGWVGMRSSG